MTITREDAIDAATKFLSSRMQSRLEIVQSISGTVYAPLDFDMRYKIIYRNNTPLRYDSWTNEFTRISSERRPGLPALVEIPAPAPVPAPEAAPGSPGGSY